MARLLTKKHQHRHWHYVYRQRRRRRAHTGREILMGQLVSLAGAVIAGYFLEIGKHEMAMVAGAFLILPGIFDLGGSIGGALAAKVAHRLERQSDLALHHGPIVRALVFAFAVTAVSAILLSAFGAVLAAVLFEGDFAVVALAGLISCLIVAVIGYPLITLATLYVFRKGFDPDNVIGPIETSIFDSLTVLALLLALKVVA
jgi:mgtE-like transporter